jgi:hypothetical protein
MSARIAGLALGWALSAVLPGSALAATCTIPSGGAALVTHVPSAGDFEFPSVDALVLQVDIDAGAGTFTLHRDDVAPIDVGTQGGPVKLLLAGPAAVGSIDASGNVTIPGFAYSEVFAGQPLPGNPALTTTSFSTDLNGVEYPGHGTPLDFSTGILTLEGADVLPNAPIVGEAVVSGISITCQLAPVPDPSTLPKALSLKSVGGVAKTGKAGKPDTLVLHAVLLPGTTGPDFAGKDVLVGIRGSGTDDAVLLLVRAGSLHKKGRKLSVRDTDGTALEVLAGRKGTQDAPAPTSGTLSVTPGKRTPLALRVQGLDLTALSGNMVVTVTVGPLVASANVAVSGSGKTRRLR